MWSKIFALIMEFESFSHVAYHDRAQNTYGYGTKATEKICITKAAAAELAINEIKKHYVNVSKLKNLNDDQKIAMVSFSYNVGENAFKNSALYRLAKSGDICRARKEFGKWVYQSGRKLKGLEKRRRVEASLFAKGFNCSKNRDDNRRAS